MAVIHTVKNKGDFGTFLTSLQTPTELGMKGSYLENTATGIINRIEKLFFGNIGRCFAVHHTTFEPAKLLECNAIIDLSAFEAMEDQTGRQIFLDVVLQYIYYYVRSHREPFNEETLPENIFILDEIQKLIPWDNYQHRHPESMIGKGPWTLRAYNISMIFIGTDPIVELPILTNTGILTIFFTKFDPYILSNLLGISKNEYLKLRSLLKPKQNERRCIVSINGQISLLKPHDFFINLNSPIDLETLQSHPLQRNLLEKYQRSVFNPVEEFKS